MVFVPVPPAAAQPASREPVRTLREKGADSYHAALTAALNAGLENALEAGDLPKAAGFINRAFAEGDPQMGCDMLRRAMDVVGTARTWTVQVAPLTRMGQRPAPHQPADEISR